jgi:predicted AAA+ superfamily ATPase
MDTLEKLIVDFQSRPLPTVSTRIATMSPVENMASVVIGMRRSGKTYFLFQEMHNLINSGVERNRILYMNFEDDRLQPIAPDILNRTLETFYRITPEARSEGAYLFLDEIQAAPGWSRFARRVLDTEAARLYISGSSAKMLSKEVATEFRGRGFAIELLPYSYKEALMFSGIDVPGSIPGSRQRSRLETAFLNYLRIGGFPDVQLLEETERIQILQDYVKLVLLRDIIERYQERNIHAVKYFSRALLQSSSSLVSVNRLSNDLRSQGVAVGRDTLYELLDHFVDAFLLFTVPIFSRSLRVRQANPRKIYAIDPGLFYAVSPAGVSNRGARLENAVYIELRRRVRASREGTVSYYLTKTGHEVDFVVGDTATGNASHLIQVCSDLSHPSTRDREVRALEEAMSELGLHEATMVTLFDDETITVEGGVIRAVPAWSWILRNMGSNLYS